ncbi:hypothetical protein [Rhabdaerophilum sp.]|uniref:hypothetical protein n=1 Tax=Rhabdaerophilum sp. TaxID=2717341 RepID=UPI0038D3C683
MNKEQIPNKLDEGQTLFSSSLARAADHFAGEDALKQNAEPADKVEIWAKRVGRGFSLIAFVALAWYFGHQLNWW